MGNSLLFLGTGGSMGIPVIGCDCSVCLSDNPKNKRLRPSVLLQIGHKNIVVDPGPDFRQQALKFYIDKLDGVILTHAHEDHVGGIDDLRIYILKYHQPIPLLLSQETLEDLEKRFYYIFHQTGQGVVTKFAPQVLREERGDTRFLDLPIRYFSYNQSGMKVTGFRMGEVAYVTDISESSGQMIEDLKGVQTLIVSALRHTPSEPHFTIDQAVDFSRKVGAKKTYFTHLAHEVDHERVSALLPEGIELGFDGLRIHI